MQRIHTITYVYTGIRASSVRSCGLFTEHCASSMAQVWIWAGVAALVLSAAVLNLGVICALGVLSRETLHAFPLFLKCLYKLCFPYTGLELLRDFGTSLVKVTLWLSQCLNIFFPFLHFGASTESRGGISSC